MSSSNAGPNAIAAAIGTTSSDTAAIRIAPIEPSTDRIAAPAGDTHADRAGRTARGEEVECRGVGRARFAVVIHRR